MENQHSSFELIAPFQRCMNYPRDEAGIEALAEGLEAAARRTGIGMEAIVARCREESMYCPTDADLFNVAKAMAGEAAPTQQQRSSRTCPSGLCDGSGWREKFTLITHHGGGSNYTEREEITEEAYETLKHKIDWKTQEAYAGRFRCQCHPADPERKRPSGVYA